MDAVSGLACFAFLSSGQAVAGSMYQAHRVKREADLVNKVVETMREQQRVQAEKPRNDQENTVATLVDVLSKALIEAKLGDTQEGQDDFGSNGRRRALAPAPSAYTLARSPAKAAVSDDGFSGFSFNEARAFADRLQENRLHKTPQDILQDLQRGNARFWMGTATQQSTSAISRRGLVSKQFPMVAILSCSDSRVPVEIVFDQGLGDIFVIRVAGNILDTTTWASLLYAVHVLHVKVVIVMGHEACGAVKASMYAPQSSLDDRGVTPTPLELMMRTIRNGLDDSILSIDEPKAREREAVCQNVKRQIEAIAADIAMVNLIREQKLIMLGAFYDITSGIVDFFHEVVPVAVASDEPTTPTASPSSGVLTTFNVPVVEIDAEERGDSKDAAGRCL